MRARRFRRQPDRPARPVAVRAGACQIRRRSRDCRDRAADWPESDAPRRLPCVLEPTPHLRHWFRLRVEKFCAARRSGWTNRRTGIPRAVVPGVIVYVFARPSEAIRAPTSGQEPTMSRTRQRRPPTADTSKPSARTAHTEPTGAFTTHVSTVRPFDRSTRT